MKTNNLSSHIIINAQIFYAFCRIQILSKHPRQSVHQVFNMPGHIKLGKAGEPDPDPLPYLIVSMEDKRKDMLKVYDSKKSYWCPDMKGGFTECMLENDDGTKATVMVGHEVKPF